MRYRSEHISPVVEVVEAVAHLAPTQRKTSLVSTSSAKAQPRPAISTFTEPLPDTLQVVVVLVWCW